MLGADHHGYVGRLQAMAACFGDDPDAQPRDPIGQLVNLVEDGAAGADEQAGRHRVTLEDLVDAIGVDAARYALARYSTDSPIDLDLDAVDRRHQRQPGLLRAVRARPDRQPCCATPPSSASTRRRRFDPELLDHERENDLLGALGEFPRVVATAAELREPHRVARYLEELAGTYHRFYDACRVLPRGDEEVDRPAPAPGSGWSRPPASCSPTACGLLGVSAPERM